MAVRALDGVDDFIRADGAFGAINKTLDWTMLLVCKMLTQAGVEAIFSIGNPTNGAQSALYVNNGTQLAWGGDDPGSDSLFTTAPPTGAWIVLAMRKTAASAAPRVMWRQIGQPTSTFVTGATAIAASTGVAATQWYFGRFSGGGSFKDLRIARAALFQDDISDSVFDTIANSASDQSLVDAGAVSILDFTQASISDPITDLLGLASQGAITGTTVVTGDDPAWTFGLGPPASFVPIGVADVSPAAGVAEYRTRERVFYSTPVDEQYLIPQKRLVLASRSYYSTVAAISAFADGAGSHKMLIVNPQGSGRSMALRIIGITSQLLANTIAVVASPRLTLERFTATVSALTGGTQLSPGEAVGSESPSVYVCSTVHPAGVGSIVMVAVANAWLPHTNLGTQVTATTGLRADSGPVGEMDWQVGGGLLGEDKDIVLEMAEGEGFLFRQADVGTTSEATERRWHINVMVEEYTDP